MSGIKIRGTGHAVPENVVTNDDLAQRIDTSDAWITERTGIRRRHICQNETQAELCAKAARMALARSGVSAQDVGVCIVATMTPENLTPSTACLLQRALGLDTDTLCFDLNAACSGFIFALHTMEALLAGSKKKFGLVVGGEAISRIVDWEDRGTCILFGDGAGAVLVESRADWLSIGAVVGSEGNDTVLFAPGPGGTKTGCLSMEGTKVFRFAVETVPKCIDEVLNRNGKTMQDVDYFVLHQANARIVDLVGKKCGLAPEKLFKNLDEYGNTSAASIPLALSEMQAQGKLRSGSRVLIVGFGGGLTWGGAIIEFA